MASSQESQENADESIPKYKEYDIPYFAHQQLDPAHFPPDIGRPLPRPTLSSVNSGAMATAGDSDDADADADDDSDGTSNDGSGVLGGSAGKNKRKRKLSKTPDGRAPKRTRPAGRPAMSKKVTADLDSDDELIVRMKNAKYQEKDIAKRLADEGRMWYNTKTIGSRWGRLRRVIQERQDELLDANLTDWHEGDDDVLKQAVKKADEAVDKMVREALERKWRLVADNMKVMKPVTNFSKNACEKRFKELEAGTAKPTPESVANPSPAVRARIEARREREKKIEQDKQEMEMAERRKANLEGNAWVSKPRKF